MEKKKKQFGSCESCEFYDYDDVTDLYACSVNLDQDEAAEYSVRKSTSCPYYRFYDEYKSVHKQI